MRFYCRPSKKFSRYFGGFVLSLSELLFFLLYSLSESSLKNYSKVILGVFNPQVFPVFFCLFFLTFVAGQALGYFMSQKSTKQLDIDQGLRIERFNGEVFEFEFNDFQAIEWSRDAFKNLVLLKKNGEKFLIYNSIKDYKKAFDLIAEKIEEAKQKNKT